MSHLPPLDVTRTAFFLDFDGTLAEIVDDPALAEIKPRTLAAVEKLAAAAGNAVAVVSGRSVAQLDRFLHPLRLPLAGVHGMERRMPDGRLMTTAVDEDAQDALQARVAAFAEANPGLLAEPKPGSVALHYRNRPDLGSTCGDLAEGLARADPRIRVVPGKMVFEMKLGTLTKADAIAAFMQEPPFRGRLPFFAGDDMTDEAGFELVNALDGISLKIGPGDTAARYRIADTATFARRLEALATGLPADAVV